MNPQVQRGMAIITAIFIMVVLGALGAFAVQVATMQHIGSAQDVISSRAYQAARAGIEWQLYNLKPQEPPPLTSPPTVCTGTPSMTLAGETFAGLTVSVICSNVGNTSRVYQIKSTACNQPNSSGDACPNTTNPNNMYVERQIEIIMQLDEPPPP